MLYFPHAALKSLANAQVLSVFFALPEKNITSQKLVVYLLTIPLRSVKWNRTTIICATNRYSNQLNYDRILILYIFLKKHNNTFTYYIFHFLRKKELENTVFCGQTLHRLWLMLLHQCSCGFHFLLSPD